MSNYRPINTGEGELYLEPGIGCPSPFEKLRICECGAVTFLDGPCRNCRKTSMKPISRTLEKQFFSDTSREMRNYSFLVLLYGITVALYVAFVLIMFARQEEFSLGIIRKVWLVITVAFYVFILIEEIRKWVITLKVLRRTTKYKFGKQVIAAYVLAHSDSPSGKRGAANGEKESWFNIVLNQYKSDIFYLQCQLEKALTDVDKESKIQEVYYAALKLSYIVDNKNLALLRLRCLQEIGLHQNSHCDIEQILHVLPAETFQTKPAVMYMIEKCLKSYSEPLSKWTVCCLMNDLKCFMEVSNDRDVVKKCITYCSGGKIRWFFENYDNLEWSELFSSVAVELLKENELFSRQIEAKL